MPGQVVSDPGAVRPARSHEFQILSTTNTADSGWIDVSGLSDWTVFLSGLESGAVIKIEVANGATAPSGHGALLTSTLAPDANGCAQFSQSVPFHWVRVFKVQGGTPTASVATLHGALIL